VQLMHLMHLKAHELLDGSSSIANKEMMFTFGSPHTLFLYYREKGELQKIVEFFERAFHCFQELSNGCGTGFEPLARAEYCLETGDLDGAGRYARKANIFLFLTTCSAIFTPIFSMPLLNTGFPDCWKQRPLYCRP